VQLLVVKSPQVPNTRSATVSPAEPDGVPGAVSFRSRNRVRIPKMDCYIRARGHCRYRRYTSYFELSTVIPSGPLRVSGPGFPNPLTPLLAAMW